jgi:hypothetical protein
MNYNSQANRFAIMIYRAKNPYAKQADMARDLGITRERVRQILKKLGLPAVTKDPVVEANRYANCESCGKKVVARHNSGLARKYCDRECFSSSRVVTIECFICGELFPMNLSQWEVRVRRFKTLTCSMKCRGVTIGRQVKVARTKKFWSSSHNSSNGIDN